MSCVPWHFFVEVVFGQFLPKNGNVWIFLNKFVTYHIAHYITAFNDVDKDSLWTQYWDLFICCLVTSATPDNIGKWPEPKFSTSKISPPPSYWPKRLKNRKFWENKWYFVLLHWPNMLSLASQCFLSDGI